MGIVVTYVEPSPTGPPDGWFEAGAAEFDGAEMEMFGMTPLVCRGCDLAGIFYEPETWELTGVPYPLVFDCPRCGHDIDAERDAIF
jgi:hypothetical protein